MRPSYLFIATVFSVAVCAICVTGQIEARQDRVSQIYSAAAKIVTDLGLSDLCLSTEARYTRNPVATDKLVVVMDHPGGIDHFPSTLFWAPPH